jgi:hypothetical protein
MPKFCQMILQHTVRMDVTWPGGNVKWLGKI